MGAHRLGDSGLTGTAMPPAFEPPLSDRGFPVNLLGIHEITRVRVDAERVVAEILYEPHPVHDSFAAVLE